MSDAKCSDKEEDDNVGWDRIDLALGIIIMYILGEVDVDVMNCDLNYVR